jgi:hypothetical protein
MVVVSTMGWSCSMSIMSMIVMSTTSTNFMELDAVVRVFFFTVKSDIGEIVPDREDRRTHDVGEEDLVEHEEYPKWDDRILTCDHPVIKYRLLYSLSVKE